MFKIGSFSKMNKVTVKTLRYYDELGLLSPSYVDEATGYRYYLASQMPRLHRILALKQYGFSLAEIIVAMEQDFSTAKMIEYLEDKQKDITRTLESERRKLVQVENYLRVLRREAVIMNYDVVLKELPSVIVASMRLIIPSYETFNSIFPEMAEIMVKDNVRCTNPGYCFTVYHDGEYKEKDIDVEICEAVVTAGRGSEKVRYKELEGVPTAACIIHKGPYHTIGISYSAVNQWIDENGFEIIGQPRESYLDGIWNKENPEDWITEIQVPVRAKR
ncbi:MerR family transcriptional regulator [bacterium]|nr:MerR family transcriptional regulator [bacterium]